MTTPELYRRHLATLDGYLADAIERAGRAGVAVDAVLFHAGRQRSYHADDQPIHFWPTPHFRRYLPLDGPEHLVLARPGRRPKAVRVRPTDYWYETADPAPSYWEEAVDLAEADSYGAALAALGDLGRAAYVGDSPEAAAEAGIPAERVEPAALMAPLDWHRATKSEHEVALLQIAAERGCAGHRAARELFAAGGSEREIHWAYLEGSGHTEAELPFPSIVALDGKAAILHYEKKRGSEAAPGRVGLIDAGGSCDGYASDLTRTWTSDEAVPEFRRLVEGVDALERELVALVTPGRSYVDVHLASHRLVAELLIEVGIVTGSAEAALAGGVTRALYPHGVGHHLGIQVHDVGGHQATPEGGTAPPPDEHPFLRNTRTLEPGHCVTIEPGVYFIPVKLDELRASGATGLVDWELVERLTPHGGVRIEDDVVCTEDAPLDLTRPHCAGPRGS